MSRGVAESKLAAKRPIYRQHQVNEMQVQKSLNGKTQIHDPEKPWKGVCCKACWNAAAKWCSCKCGGAYHGHGHNGHRDQEDPTLPQQLVRKKFLSQMTKATCHACGANIIGEAVHHYEHDGGWKVPGFEKRQWLYVVCPKCQNQISLWKLGVARDPEENQTQLPGGKPHV